MRFLRGPRTKEASFPMLQRDGRQGPIWKSAVDPASGRTYYFEAVSRKSQWEKPEELVTAEELFARKKKLAEDLTFFGEMERNIMAKIRRGSTVPVAAVAAATLSTLIIPSASSESDIIPFSPTSSHSSRSDTNSSVTREYAPSLMRAPSSSSEYSSTSSRSSRDASHVRRNTTGTIHLKETPFSFDVDSTIEAICIVYRNFIVESFVERIPSSSPVSVHDIFTDLQASIFDDRSSSLVEKHAILVKRMRGREASVYSQCPTDMRAGTAVPPDSHVTSIPSLEEITSLYRFIYENCQMEKDVLLTSLVYCERLISETKGTIQPNERNWRSILFSCLTLASKVWDDCSMWNVDFSYVCEKGDECLEPFTLRRINMLEVALLKCLNFNANVSASEYTRCYFHLQNVQSLTAHCDEPGPKLLGIERAVKFGLLSSKSDPRTIAFLHQRRASSSEGMQEDEVFGDVWTDSPRRLRKRRASNVCLEQLVSM